MRRVSWLDKTWRLFHVDRFVEITMDEGILDVQLANVLAVDQGNSDNNPDGAQSDNR